MWSQIVTDRRLLWTPVNPFQRGRPAAAVQWHIDYRLMWSIMHDTPTHWPRIRGSSYETVRHCRISRVDPARHGALLNGSNRQSISRESQNASNADFESHEHEHTNHYYAVAVYYRLTRPLIHRLFLLNEPTFTSFLIGRFISGNAIYGNRRLFPDDVGIRRKRRCSYEYASMTVYGSSFRVHSFTVERAWEIFRNLQMTIIAETSHSFTSRVIYQSMLMTTTK